MVKSYNRAVILTAANLLMVVPAFAQSTAGSPATVQKQHTDGGDSPDNPRATDQAAAAWHKQHIGGLPAGTNPPQYGTDWANAQKQSTQSNSHSAVPAAAGAATKQQ
jgi:hypothetical protein